MDNRNWKQNTGQHKLRKQSQRNELEKNKFLSGLIKYIKK